VERLIEKIGLSEFKDWCLDSVAASTLRNYRRGFTLFVRLAKECQLDPFNIASADVGLAILLKVIKLAFQKKVKLSAVSVMKTAVVRLFEFVFNVDLSQVAILKMAMKRYTLAFLPKKHDLKLQWSVDKLFDFLMSLDQWEKLDFDMLVQVSIVLCMVFSTLRFTEIYSLNMVQSDPDEKLGVWKFWTHVKGHDFEEPVYLHMVDEPHLSPVAALVELRKRIKALDASVTSFWVKLLDGKVVLLKYDEVRKAAVNVLARAGINEHRPYHIKHAVLTCLDQRGMSAKDIAAFARHNFGSMSAYKHYISYDGGRANVNELVKVAKKKKN
jgi:hypothetical protein